MFGLMEVLWLKVSIVMLVGGMLWQLLVLFLFIKVIRCFRLGLWLIMSSWLILWWLLINLVKVFGVVLYMVFFSCFFMKLVMFSIVLRVLWVWWVGEYSMQFGSRLLFLSQWLVVLVLVSLIGDSGWFRLVWLVLVVLVWVWCSRISFCMGFFLYQVFFSYFNSGFQLFWCLCIWVEWQLNRFCFNLIIIIQFWLLCNCVIIL